MLTNFFDKMERYINIVLTSKNHNSRYFQFAKHSIKKLLIDFDFHDLTSNTLINRYYLGID